MPDNIDYTELCISLGLNGLVVGDEYRARCPLHHDAHPSFSLNTETGLWICHSKCGAGNFYQLVERVLNCNQGEAQEWINTNGRKSSVEVMYARMADIINRPLSVLPTPKNDGWKNYFASLDNTVMPNWFLDRGFTWSTVVHWQIRYDRLRDAVVVPVFWEGDFKGIIIRNTRPELPKYENSEFLKSELVFGEFLPQKAFIILVEGVLDAVWLWQLGYNAVSILGSSIGQKQVEILRQYRFGEIILALDNDEAGIAGTSRAVTMLTQNGWMLPQIKKVVFPGAKGDVLYRKDAQDCSEEEFRSLFDNRRDYFQWQTKANHLA